MIDLLGCVLCTGLLFIQFREYGRRGWPLLPIVSINYVVCVLCGVLYDATLFERMASSGKAWWWLGLLQGGLFISMFVLQGRAAHQIGLGYATLVTKMSMVMPTLLSVYSMNEQLTLLQVVGFVAALVAVVLIHLPHVQGGGGQRQWLVWGAVLFVGTGIIDSNFKIFQVLYAGILPGAAFTVAVFGTAGVLGCLYWAVLALRGQQAWHRPSVWAGILLGVPNFFSVIFLVRALGQLPGSVFFPLNNIGLLLFVSVVGIVIYRERYTATGWAGLGMAALAILLLAL